MRNTDCDHAELGSVYEKTADAYYPPLEETVEKKVDSVIALIVEKLESADRAHELKEKNIESEIDEFFVENKPVDERDELVVEELSDLCHITPSADVIDDIVDNLMSLDPEYLVDKSDLLSDPVAEATEFSEATDPLESIIIFVVGAEQFTERPVEPPAEPPYLPPPQDVNPWSGLLDNDPYS